MNLLNSMADSTRGAFETVGVRGRLALMSLSRARHRDRASRYRYSYSICVVLIDFTQRTR